MYAIIETGGKQYKVTEGEIIYVELLGANEGDKYTFETVLAVSTGDELKVGAPYVKGATVTADVLGDVKGKKIHVLRYKAKKNEKRKLGHRQPYTKVQISAING